MKVIIDGGKDIDNKNVEIILDDLQCEDPYIDITIHGPGQVHLATVHLDELMSGLIGFQDLFTKRNEIKDISTND